MSRTGRKQLTVLITEESFSKFEEIKKETNLSNAKIVEMLIANHTNINTNINTNSGITEERMKVLLKEALSGITISTDEYIDLAPPLPELTMEDFYGKVEEPPVYEPDMDDPLERRMREAGMY